MLGALFTTVLDQGGNLHLVGIAELAVVLVGIVPVGLVHFDGTTVRSQRAAHLYVHSLADGMGHEPGGLVGYAQSTVKLMGAHALLARTNQVGRQNPLVKGNLGALEHSPDRDCVLLAAMPTEIKSRTVGFAF